jgi:adhesin transport system membrane fusion protein
MHPKVSGERIVIQPGMTATAEIKTGRTTVFRYLTKPILKTTSEAMGER